MYKITLLFFLMVFHSDCLLSQDKLSKKVQDSICKTAQKISEPKRKSISFPAITLSDENKLAALKKALPDSLGNENHPLHWFYNYYFNASITDYDPVGDSLTYPSVDPLKYKLDHTYFFDINGDGLLDFIHYTLYYRALFLSHDSYEIFIQQNDGSYKIQQFNGFITEIKFNKNNSVRLIKTYMGACCTNRENYFYEYVFSKNKMDLFAKKAQMVLTCQFQTKTPH